MRAEPERSIEERIISIRSGEVSDGDLPALVSEIQKAIEEQRQHEQEIERFAKERRALIRAHQIESVYENEHEPFN